MTGSDLDVAQVSASVEHGRDLGGLAERVGGCALAIEEIPAASARWRRRRVAACRSCTVGQVFGGSARGLWSLRHGRWPGRLRAGQRGPGRSLVPLHAHRLTGGRVPRRGRRCRAGGFEDPQAQQAKHGCKREIARVRRLPGGGERGLELRVQCESERR